MFLFKYRPNQLYVLSLIERQINSLLRKAFLLSNFTCIYSSITIWNNFFIDNFIIKRLKCHFDIGSFATTTWTTSARIATPILNLTTAMIASITHTCKSLELFGVKRRMCYYINNYRSKNVLSTPLFSRTNRQKL